MNSHEEAIRMRKRRQQNKINFVKTICFLVIFCVLFSVVNTIMKRKTLTSSWNMSIKIAGLANEPKNSMDVMYFGSSHMYCTINPLELFHETGITSYVYAMQNQPLWSSYYYMKEAFKHQSPKVVVLDVYPVAFYNGKDYADESVNFPTTDEIPFSKNKIDLVEASVPKKERANHYIEFLKYHSRWKELTNYDFNLNYRKETDYLKGYVLLRDTNPQAFDENVYKLTGTTQISEKNLLYLNKIVELSKEKNFKLVFMVTPYQMLEDQKKVFNEIEVYAKKNGISFVDYNPQIQKLGLDLNADYYDKGHVNYKGAAKITDDFGQFLINKFRLADKRNDKTYQNWNWDYTAYQKNIKK